MKKLIFIISLIILSGCSEPDLRSKDGRGYDTVCIDGVFYLVRKSGYAGYMAPYLYPDGKPHTCGE